MKARSQFLVVLGLVLLMALPVQAVEIWLRQSDGTITQLSGTGSAADVNFTRQLGGEHVDPSVEENGYLRVQPRAGTVGGSLIYSLISAGVTEDEHGICTAACTLYSIAATNTNAAVRYLKCFNNVAASTTPGTSTPVLRLALPSTLAGGPAVFPFPVGVSFASGLTCWLVTGAADSDVAEVAANELMVNYSYKQ